VPQQFLNSTYIIIGLQEVACKTGFVKGSPIKTITYVGTVGATPYLSEYSPIPFTHMWKEAGAVARFDLASDPLFHNNTIFPCWNEESLEKVSTLKNMAQDIRKKAW
jgi:hypothetical protein